MRYCGAGHACALPKTPPRCGCARRRCCSPTAPFGETKEWIAGYDIIECEDLDEAIEVASKHPVARFGSIEVRPLCVE